MSRRARNAADVNRSLISEAGEMIERAARDAVAPPPEPAPRIREIDPKNLPHYALGPELVPFPMRRRGRRP